MRHYKNSRQSFVQLGITDNIIAGVCITKGCIETGNIVTGSLLAASHQRTQSLVTLLIP